MGAVTFYNRTNNGPWNAAGHEIEVTVHEGKSLVGTSKKIRLGDNWSYERKTDIKYKITSLTVVSGWEPFKSEVYGSASATFHVVESRHGLKFNISLEWPPRFPEKL
jgi:hypothetical protein